MNFQERADAFRAKGKAIQKANEKIERIQRLISAAWIFFVLVVGALMWSGLTIHSFIIVMVGAIVTHWIVVRAVNIFYVEPEIRRINNDYPIPPREES